MKDMLEFPESLVCFPFSVLLDSESQTLVKNISLQKVISESHCDNLPGGCSSTLEEIELRCALIW